MIIFSGGIRGDAMDRLIGILFVSIDEFREWFECNFKLPFWVKVRDGWYYWNSGDFIGKVQVVELYGKEFLKVYYSGENLKEFVEKLQEVGDDIAWKLLVLITESLL